MINKIILALCTVIIVSLVPIAFSEGHEELKLNKVVTVNNVSYDIKGNAFLPLKDIVTKLGGNVNYNQIDKLIEISLNDINVSYSLKEKVITIKDKYYNNYESFMIKKGISYISLSYLSIYFNCDFEKDNQLLTVTSFYNNNGLQSIKPLFIAHGGGEFSGKAITNSKEAILNSIEQGAHIIELDFLKTTDDKYVFGHDWGSVNSLYKPSSNQFSYENYISLQNTIYTPLGLDDLITILDNNKKVRIVTDSKDNNYDYLYYIKLKYPDYLNRFIPQIYEMQDYNQVNKLGFNDIIYTLYKIYKTDLTIIDFAKNNNLYAITMAESRATPMFLTRLNKLGVTTYVHTINTFKDFKYYQNVGISGVYTDNLYQSTAVK